MTMGAMLRLSGGIEETTLAKLFSASYALTRMAGLTSVIDTRISSISRMEVWYEVNVRSWGRSTHRHSP